MALGLPSLRFLGLSLLGTLLAAGCGATENQGAGAGAAGKGGASAATSLPAGSGGGGAGGGSAGDSPATGSGGASRASGGASAGSAGLATESGGEAGASGAPFVPSSTNPLGMNDVSFLLPLPTDVAIPVISNLSDNGGLVPLDLFTRVVTTPRDVLQGYEKFQLVAIRFDLCDRSQPGTCPPDQDGRLRLVFQPVGGTTTITAADTAIHAFYPIPNAELASLVDGLRRLATLSTIATNSPLIVNTAVADASYSAALRALVSRYAVSPRLTRLTLFSQNANHAALVWELRGVELSGASFVDISIPGINANQQEVTLVGLDPGYKVVPVADSPAGLLVALDSTAFYGAASSDRQLSVIALAQAQNPTLHTPQTEQCVACHVSTYLTAHRASDPAATAGRFTSSYDLSIAAGVSATSERSLRAFGWVGTEPAISQRVANDTAQVLTEIEQRFPAPK